MGVRGWGIFEVPSRWCVAAAVFWVAEAAIAAPVCVPPGAATPAPSIVAPQAAYIPPPNGGTGAFILDGSRGMAGFIRDTEGCRSRKKHLFPRRPGDRASLQEYRESSAP
jgi:hypothetical protein